MIKWTVFLFLQFFTLYSKVHILAICNNYEYDVGMNCNVKFVETYDRNSEHILMKCKSIVIIVWNIL